MCFKFLECAHVTFRYFNYFTFVILIKLSFLDHWWFAFISRFVKIKYICVQYENSFESYIKLSNIMRTCVSKVHCIPRLIV